MKNRSKAKQRWKEGVPLYCGGSCNIASSQTVADTRSPTPPVPMSARKKSAVDLKRNINREDHCLMRPPPQAKDSLGDPAKASELGNAQPPWPQCRHVKYREKLGVKLLLNSAARGKSKRP